MKSVVWIIEAYKNKFGINQKFAKYLKESCVLDLDQHFSIKYFLKIAIIKEMLLKQLGGFGHYRHEKCFLTHL